MDQVWVVTYEYNNGSSVTLFQTEENAIWYAVHTALSVLHDTVDTFSPNGKAIIAKIREALEQKNWHNVLAFWGEAQDVESITIASATMVREVDEPSIGNCCPVCLHVINEDDVDGGRCTCCMSMLS